MHTTERSEPCERSFAIERLLALGVTVYPVNRTRNLRIYADLAQRLIVRARRLYAEEPLGIELDQTIYALDSTTIELCLGLFPWARFRSTKAAVKLHTLLGMRSPIPTMIAISEGKQADVRDLDELIPEPGAFNVMDRGYLDFERLYRFVLTGAFFVTRTKAGVQLNRLQSRPVDRSTGIRSDHIAWLRNPQSAAHYPDHLRRVPFRDPEDGKVLVFLTSDNAVKTQVWIAICVYVLVAIIRKELHIELSLSQILQILTVNAFEQVPLAELITNTQSQDKWSYPSNQLMLCG